MNLISTLGADPECFLFDPKNNKFISSVGLIGGTKDNFRPIDDIGNGVLEDNVAVEFNTPPCHTKEEFTKNIKFNIEWIQNRAKELGYEISFKPSARFDEDQLQSEGAQEFGCLPDFNAWTNGRQNPRPSAADGNLRSCGGHVHIALSNGEDILEVIKAMDLFVGCLMLEFDEDKGRRELYGKAGAFRKKSYGVEYRTASNAWIESDERIQWVWDQTDKALDFVARGNSFTFEQGQMIQECINNSNMELLHHLKQEFQL